MTKGASNDSLFGWDYYGGDNIHSGRPFLRSFNIYQNNDMFFIIILTEDDYGCTVFSNYITKENAKKLIDFIARLDIKIS